jgi:uncharacterized protein (DUF302 family)
MNTMITGILIGLPAGVLTSFLFFYLAASRLLFRESVSPFTFDATVAKIEEAVLQKGWKIPAVHDLRATLQKFGKDVRSVKVFEICSPDLSYQILSRNQERIASSMMPCRMAVYEKEDGTVRISMMNAGVMARPMTRIIRRTMTAATRETERIIADVLAV